MIMHTNEIFNNPAPRAAPLGHRLGTVLRDVFTGFDALTRIQYDKPWERSERDQTRHRDLLEARRNARH